MSLSRKTYSPMSHTYSYSTTLSPSYSYSRVSTYLDALERDEAITKLKRQLTSVKSVEMKYQTLLQEIAIAQRENRLLEQKNNDIEQEYIQKIQQNKLQTNQMQDQLNSLNERLNQQQKNVSEVQTQIQSLLQQLKSLKLEEQQIEAQNWKLCQQVEQCSVHIQKLKQQQSQQTAKKNSLHEKSKSTEQDMQKSLSQLTSLTEMIQKYVEELSILQKQSQRFSLEWENIQTIYKKNLVMMENLQRKTNIQDGENQQLKIQLNQMAEAWEKMKNKVQTDKQSLYDNIVKVEEKSMILKQTLSELDNNLETDSTQKKYLKDIAARQGKLSGQNQQLREVLKLLQENYASKKSEQVQLVQQINQKIRLDQKLKQGIEQRFKQLMRIKQQISK